MEEPVVDQREWARVVRAVQDPAAEPARWPALSEVVGLGLDVSPDSVGCSVTLAAGEGWVTPGATGPVAMELDAAQYRAGAGPCIAAACDGGVREVDLTAEPAAGYEGFVAAARAHGVGASLSVPLPAAARPAALNLYAATPGAFTAPRARAVAALLARVVTTVLTPAVSTAVGVDAASLDDAREQRGVVLAARDAVAAARGVTAVEAFEVLTRRAAAEQRRLTEVAHAVLAERPGAEGGGGRGERDTVGGAR